MGEHAGAANHSWKGGRTFDAQGYVVLTMPKAEWPYHSAPRGQGGRILEHTYVMENHIGRKLVRGENVHHKNGVRTDNRIDNLELWSTQQPPGQRVADKLKWAEDIMRLYNHPWVPK